jgi:hypothetical protein
VKRNSRVPIELCPLFLLLFIAATALAPIGAESFRGEFTLSVTPAPSGQINESGSSTYEGSFSLFDLARIQYPENPLAESIRLILDIARNFLRYRDSFSLSIYGNYYPSSGEGIRNFSGSLLYQDMLPNFSRVSILIPLTKGSRQSGGAGVIQLKEQIDLSTFPLALQIVPIMKGLPAGMVTSAIPVTAELIIEDAGFLQMSILDPEGAPISSLPPEGVYRIDGKEIDQEQLLQPLKLSSGVHSLQLEIPGFAGENSSFSIARGETTQRSIKLQPLLGTYRIRAPRGTTMYIDGEQIPSDSEDSLKGELSPGEHLLLFRFGDYQLSRKIDVQGGKEYTIELFFDILVEVR